MLANLAAIDAIAQNLANASTTGYKQDVPRFESFQSVLLDRMSGAASSETGTLGNGVAVGGVFTDFTQGPMQSTGNPYDIALTGNAYLTINTPGGTEYSRDGALTRDSNGNLVQAGSGATVLDDAGQPINIPSTAKVVNITSQGSILADGQPVAKLGIVDIDQKTAVKVGNNAYVAGSTTAMGSGDSVRQGFLEMSNVNTVQAMISMINAQRSYETASKMLQAEDSTTAKALGTVAVLS